MVYLLGTDIKNKVRGNIRGSVARVGGTVNQVVMYGPDTRITDINVLDGGYGYVKKVSEIRSLRNLAGTVKRFMRQEYRRLREGERFPIDRKTVILDLHDAASRPDLKHHFDACITSNVIEHSPNPLFFLLNSYFITKKGGYQFHAIPHYRYTFDMYRKPTPLAHFIEDFERKTPLTDTTHVEDYTQSAIVKHGWQKKLHSAYPVAYPFMHHHVYDEHITRAVVEYMFTGVTVDIFRSPEYADSVVFFKNELNPEFLRKHRKHIDAYSKIYLS